MKVDKPIKAPEPKISNPEESTAVQMPEKTKGVQEQLASQEESKTIATPAGQNPFAFPSKPTKSTAVAVQPFASKVASVGGPRRPIKSLQLITN